MTPTAREAIQGLVTQLDRKAQIVRALDHELSSAYSWCACQVSALLAGVPEPPKDYGPDQICQQCGVIRPCGAHDRGVPEVAAPHAPQCGFKDGLPCICSASQPMRSKVAAPGAQDGRCRTCRGEGEIETGQSSSARCVDCGGSGKTGGEPPNRPRVPLPGAGASEACKNGHQFTKTDCAYRGGEWDWPCDCGEFSRDFPPDELEVPSPPDGWQDISNAPKDGTWVLLHNGRSHSLAAGYVVGAWSDHHTATGDHAWTDGEYTYSPTHWMPLPPPPQPPRDEP